MSLSMNDPPTREEWPPQIQLVNTNTAQTTSTMVFRGCSPALYNTFAILEKLGFKPTSDVGMQVSFGCDAEGAIER